MSVTRIKIEKGNKATDWTPAPEDKLSEGVSYAGVVINATNGFVNTATLGGKTATIKVNATEGLAFYDGSTYRGGMQVIGSDLALITDIIKSPNNANTYIKFTADPDWLSAGLYAGVTNFFATDNNFSIGTAQKHFSIIGYLYPASSQTILNASDRGGMEAGMEIIAGTKASGAPVDVSALILYGGTDTSNIAQLVVYKADGTPYDLTISPISGLTYNSGKVWHSGNDGSGSGLDADTVDGEHISSGTWTPTLKGSGGTAYTLTTATGRYYKVGKQVTCWFTLACASAMSDPYYVFIPALPFTPANTEATAGVACSPQGTNGISSIHRVLVQASSGLQCIIYSTLHPGYPTVQCTSNISGCITYQATS